MMHEFHSPTRDYPNNQPARFLRQLDVDYPGISESPICTNHEPSAAEVQNDKPIGESLGALKYGNFFELPLKQRLVYEMVPGLWPTATEQRQKEPSPVKDDDDTDSSPPSHEWAFDHTRLRRNVTSQERPQSCNNCNTMPAVERLRPFQPPIKKQ
jgi:hypothetical protein